LPSSAREKIPASWRLGWAGFKSGPEHIEDGRDSALGELFADGRDRFESGMVSGREEESTADRFQRSPQLRRRQIYPDAELLQHVRAAAGGGDCAIAVLHHHRAARGQDEHAGGRNIEELQPVAASAADIDHRPRQASGIDLRIHRVPEQGAHEGRNLGGRFTLGPERLEEGCFHSVRHVWRKQTRDRGFDFLHCEITSVLKMREEFLHGSTRFNPARGKRPA
jgi:hypothetical protein